MQKAFFNSNRVLAVFSDREGGVSKKPYDSLNIALHVGDDIRDVAENRVLLSEKFFYEASNLIYMQQIHGDNIEIINDSFENEIKKCDGIITNKINIPLMVMVADCIPTLLYDSKNQAVGAVHAGRNGSFKNIVVKAILKMQKEFGSKVEDIKVSFGPSIKSCCYEVGEDLAKIAIKNFSQKYVQKRDEKFYLDLESLNFDEIINIGVKSENIEIFKECSCCESRYFSYRREGVTGRFAGVIMLR